MCLVFLLETQTFADVFDDILADNRRGEWKQFQQVCVDLLWNIILRAVLLHRSVVCNFNDSCLSWLPVCLAKYVTCD